MTKKHPIRIAQLTPGTGDFYCGSCLRDRMQVDALRAMGHDVMMVPMYLPHLSDQTEHAETPADEPLFFGAMNVYLQQKSWLFRHTPRWIDRWLDRQGLLHWVIRFSHWTQAKDLGELTESMLRGQLGRQVKELDRLIDYLKTQSVDLICLSNVLLVGLAQPLREALDVPVVCQLQGEDAFLDELIEPYRGRCWQLLQQQVAHVDQFIAVSDYYRRQMADRLALESQAIQVVHNGIDLTAYEEVAPHTRPKVPTIGYLARQCEDKGLALLVEAFILLKQRHRYADDALANVRLHIAGSVRSDDQAFVALQKQRLEEADCLAAVTFFPNLPSEAKVDFLTDLSLLSVPAIYGESFGLYLLEAWAAGRPVVQPDTAAFTELINITQGGRLCEVHSASSLAQAIETVLSDSALAMDLGQRGQQCVRQQFTDQQMAEQMTQVYKEAIEHYTTREP